MQQHNIVSAPRGDLAGHAPPMLTIVRHGALLYNNNNNNNNNNIYIYIYIYIYYLMFLLQEKFFLPWLLGNVLPA
jgi:hypothetical protein